jgi:hypothetical protein
MKGCIPIKSGDVGFWFLVLGFWVFGFSFWLWVFGLELGFWFEVRCLV